MLSKTISIIFVLNISFVLLSCSPEKTTPTPNPITQESRFKPLFYSQDSLYLSFKYGFNHYLMPCFDCGRVNSDRVLFRLKEYAPILAPLDGTVTEISEGRVAGDFIIIQHSPQLKVRYQHLSETCVEVGASIKAGQEIAVSGKTGLVTKNGLGITAFINGKKADPVGHVLDSLGKIKYNARN